MRLVPKFLTQEIAYAAIAAITEAFKKDVALGLGSGYSIVVLVPSMVCSNEEGSAIEWPDYKVEAHSLAIVNHSPITWVYPLVEIAQCKALQLWHGRNDGRTDIMPHLLFPGDAPFWGGVKRDGIVVVCSGLEPHYDRMIAGMVADMCIARAYDAWMQSEDKKKDVALLT